MQLKSFKPFAIWDAVAQEIDCLEDIGVLEKVEFSRWATTLIVPVPKCEGIPSACVGISMSCTLNAALEVDQHPIPKPAFTSLAGHTISPD